MAFTFEEMFTFLAWNFYRVFSGEAEKAVKIVEKLKILWERLNPLSLLLLRL